MAEAKKVYRKNKKNGVTYIYLDEPYWDVAAKMGRHRMKCIGKVGPDGEDVYNEAYKASLEDGRPVMVSKTVQLGERMILDKVSSFTGLKRVLRKSFGKEDGDYILALAYFVICTGDPLYLAEHWCAQRGIEGRFSSQASSKFLEKINEDEVNEFFREWMIEHSDKRTLLFDITSISSYSNNLSHVERGHNRDNENLGQINLTLLSSYGSMLPLWFSRTDGSLNDSVQLKSMVETIKKLGIDWIALTADRGFYSDANLRMLHEEGMHFTLPVPSSVSWQKELIDSYRKDIYSPKKLIADEDSIIYAATKCDRSSPYGRVWKHVYYDASRKERVIADLMKRISRCLDALDKGNALNASDSSFAEKYIIVKETPKRGRKVSVNQNAVDAFISGQACWWGIISNCEKDASKALSSYRQRNEVEVLFDDFKNSLTGDRTRSHGDSTLFGRLFILFVALIVAMKLRMMVDAIPGKERKWWNWKEFLRHSSTYGKCSFSGKYKDVYTAPTKGQRMIFNALGISYMWKGKLVTLKDSETVEAEACDDESGVNDIAQNMEPDES